MNLNDDLLFIYIHDNILYYFSLQPREREIFKTITKNYKAKKFKCQF